MDSIAYVPDSAAQHANTASAMNLLYLALIFLPVYLAFLVSYFRRNDAEPNAIIIIACSCIGFGVLIRCTVMSHFGIRFEDVVDSLQSWYSNNQKSTTTANTTNCVLLFALLGYVSVGRYAYELMERCLPPLDNGAMETPVRASSPEVDGSFKDRLECV